MDDWEERAARAMERHDDGAARLPEDEDERQRQLTRMGNAAWAAGLSLLMAGRDEEARCGSCARPSATARAGRTRRAGSWGRPIGAMKSRLIAGDREGALADARWALDAGAAESESPIGRYAAALAHLVRGEDADAAELAATLEGRDDFPPPVADSLVALAGRRRRCVRDGDPCAARRLRGAGTSSSRTFRSPTPCSRCRRLVRGVGSPYGWTRPWFLPPVRAEA